MAQCHSHHSDILKRRTKQSSFLWKTSGVLILLETAKTRAALSLMKSTDTSNCSYVTRSKLLPLVWCGSLERGCQLRCRPRHLTVVQNRSVQNSRRVASKRDVNITKLALEVSSRLRSWAGPS
ncbi:hypothetical protein AVEN_123928-1 [Araneus ventricosus]|uniref:Uncharacterized protein n=1 Tax=Araneus ventricosus TaxID=182803 RepID=A0A4Y2Q6N9_ARAVE|nr:hypothetical protein AVEN_123928-1 [Araneus ventricosus]